MKNVKLVMLSLLLVFLSCSDEKENLHVLESHEKETLHSVRAKGGDKITSNNTPYSLNEEENMMYMTSYLIGLTLLQDQAARDYFYQELTGKPLKISLRALLDGTDNPFEIAFRARYYIYNWNTDPKGEPTPPISSAVPDPLERDYAVLHMGYFTYFHLISNTYDWDIHLPNKSLLFNYFNFNQYLNDKEYIINLWDMDTGLYDDGLKMSNGTKTFIPSGFDYSQELNNLLILTLRNAGSYSI
ncbi:hypothetical protein ACOSP6_06465 [Tenacibaculum sp. MEBiC06402]|uniref:hypothetical protein n=1 Tax=unclassified Tenacibaculum TaxID=2635139 RepID=UPI003B9B8F3E